MMLPCSTGITPAMASMSVLLPAPLLPSKTVICPSGQVRLTSRTMVSSPRLIVAPLTASSAPMRFACLLVVGNGRSDAAGRHLLEFFLRGHVVTEIGGRDIRPLQDLGGRAGGDDLAEVEHHQRRAHKPHQF